MAGDLDSVQWLEPGDLIDLQGDPYADPHCEVGCVFRSQFALVAERPEFVDESGVGSHVRVVFVTDTGDADSDERYERHTVVFPRHHQVVFA